MNCSSATAVHRWISEETAPKGALKVEEVSRGEEVGGCGESTDFVGCESYVDNT